MSKITNSSYGVNINSKQQTFYSILKAFSSDTPQSKKRQNKGPKEHDEKYKTQLWVEIGPSEKRKHMTGIIVQSIPPAYIRSEILLIRYLQASL